MDRQSLLQIATRIHFALLKEIGTGIDIGAMLRQQGYALEVIYLCRACNDPEIRALGERFESLAPDDPPFAHAMPRAKKPLHRRATSNPHRVQVDRRHPPDFAFASSMTSLIAATTSVRVTSACERPAWFGRVLFKLAH